LSQGGSDGGFPKLPGVDLIYHQRYLGDRWMPLTIRLVPAQASQRKSGAQECSAARRNSHGRRWAAWWRSPEENSSVPGQAGSCTVWPRCGWSMAAPEARRCNAAGGSRSHSRQRFGGRSGRSVQVIGRGRWASGWPASGTGADGQQAQVHSASLPPRQSRPAPVGVRFRH
jgi:hypothetical protein